MPGIRTIEIDEKKCTGCGQCVLACHEGVIALQNGKAKVVRGNLCDGLGSCIPACPEGAIHFVEKEIAWCPHSHPVASPHWPVKLRLVSPLHDFAHRDLVIAADCSAFVTPDFHAFLQGRRVFIGCPKFDDLESYRKKLQTVFAHQTPRSVEIIHMEVPCCWDLWSLGETVIKEVGKLIPIHRTVLGVDGQRKE